MPCVVITGGPGAGKTSLLRELARLGYQTAPESARAIIAERRARGESPRPDPKVFALEILRRDIENHERLSATPDWVFFDRAIPEALAMVQEASAMAPEPVAALRLRHRFHRRVFVLPPWDAIYRQDAERDQTPAEALAVYRRVVDCYQALGYDLQQVPPSTVEERAGLVLAATAGRTTWK
jgi:predicted ATPase